MDAPSEALPTIGIESGAPDFETIFHTQYARIARLIARVTGDQGRAEELAVEVFLKLWRNPKAQGGNLGGWLYRAAIRKGLDELRRRARWNRYERFLTAPRRAATPEEIHATSEERQKVRSILAGLNACKAELLLLRANGFNYEEIATILDLNAASIGTLLSRAQQSFRKEYVKRYGSQ